MQAFYGLCTSQPALADTTVKNWRILLKLIFTAHNMSLLKVTSKFGRENICWSSAQPLPTPSP